MRLMQSGVLPATAASLLALAACNPATDAQNKSPAAVTVNGTAISQRTVDKLAKQNAGPGRPDTPESRRFIVDQLALQLVVAEEAVRKGLDKKAEIAEQIDAMKQSVLANAYVQDFFKNNPVSDDIVKAEYERIKATITGAEYKARHILVEKESEAKDVIARLRKEPGAFAKLAMEKSKDTGSRPRGGDLGWFDARGMVPEFGAALGKLEKGKFTLEPVRTQFGYHVILLEDSRPITAPPMEEVKDQISQQLQEQNLKKQLDALKAKAKIEISSAPAAAPAPPVPAAIKSK
jgi:peptidyl-prolyl cis-trans isomerase C